MLLSQLLTDVSIKSEYKDAEITDVTESSVGITPGCVFVAVEGTHFDGHEFVREAVERGAAAVVVSRDVGLECQVIVENTREAYALMCKNLFGRADEQLKIIGITGTNGKSTTSAVLRDIFASLDIKCGSIGTLGNMVGEKHFPTTFTTPDSHEIHRLFRMMADDGIEYAIIEATSQALDQRRLAGITFDVAVFTNLTQDHLDYHGSIENYRACKSRLFGQSRISLVNTDDESAEYMINAAAQRVVTYAVNSNADYKAVEPKLKSNGVTYEVNGETVNFKTPGKFSVYNSLAAVCTLTCLGFPFKSVCEAAGEATTLKGRLEMLKTDAPFKIVIDYAHTPDGFEKLLETVRGFTAGRIITVFGCGGDRDKTKRPKMGRIAADLCDVAIVTTDNPRTEEPAVIIKEILIGMVGSKAKVMTFLDRTDAIEKALELAGPDDTVLLAGKGHETYQIIGTSRVHYDEREIVCDYLERSYNGEA